MYYFKYGEDLLDTIVVEGKYLDSNIECKVKITLDPKNILNICFIDSDDNLTPIKKSSSLRKKIFEYLMEKQWNKFIMQNCEIEGFVNEDNENIEPFYVLIPKNNKKIKINPYDKWKHILISNGFPLIDDTKEVILHKKDGIFQHIYYRKNNKIIHICIDEYEQKITYSEIFNKILENF